MGFVWILITFSALCNSPECLLHPSLGQTSATKNQCVGNRAGAVSGSEIAVRSLESLAWTSLCGARQGDCPKAWAGLLLPLIMCWIGFPPLLLFGLSFHGMAGTLKNKKEGRGREEKKNEPPKPCNLDLGMERPVLSCANRAWCARGEQAEPAGPGAGHGSPPIVGAVPAAQTPLCEVNNSTRLGG